MMVATTIHAPIAQAEPRRDVAGGRPMAAARIRRSGRASALAVALVIWLIGPPAFAACTLDDIETCIHADPATAEQLLLQEIAANHDPARTTQLADLYRTGPQQFRDYMRAAWYYQRAIDAGNPGAMVGMADMLIKGNGVVADPKRAVALLKQAADSGLRGPALAALGSYYRGIGDFARALDALQQATDAGDSSATRVLADMFAKGEGTAADPARANALVSVLPPAEAPAPEAPIEVRPDPPSTLAGRQLPLMEVLRIAYAAGFRTEDQLLAAAGTAISESGLWSAARNWHPERGFRPASDVIGVTGPAGAWSSDGRRQMHSDRGIWQIASWAWSRFPDRITDDPAKCAAAAFEVSWHGTDFSAWDSYVSGYAQRHFDRAYDGWPPLRPLVRNFLLTVGAAPTQ